MRTLRRIRTLALATGLLALFAGHAQVTNPTNNAAFGDYVGCDNTSPFPLRVMQNDNQPIQWWTDSLHRMQLFHTMPPATINGFPNIARNGYLGISPVEAFYTNPGPFSRLHLVDTGAAATNYAQDFGWRPWMRNGVTMTGNSDQMYIGHKYTYVDSTDYQSGEINDRSDAVIEWSDNPDDAPWGTDRLRFMFTNDYQVASPETYGARSLEGMEAMRIFIPTDTTAHVGIGDFFRAGVINGQNEDPTERLHVRDGRVRIQELPDNAPADSDYVVMVVDTTANPSGERGVVKWVPVSSLLSVADCEWSMTPGSGAGVNDVWTAVGTLVDDCPDETEAVGIGTNNPQAKLDIVTGNSYITGVGVTSAGTGATNIGALLDVTGATVSNQALLAAAYGTGTNNIAASLTTNGGSNSNTGLTALVSGASVTNMGARLTVSGGSQANIGGDITLTGAAIANTGSRTTVSGSAIENTGGAITVNGTSANNTGMSIRTNDGAPLNQAIFTNAFSTGANLVNYGLYHRGTTGSETSQNRGMQIELSGAADRVRGVEVISSCTNSGTSLNATQYGGNFRCEGTGFRDSFGVIGDANGAIAGSGRNRGVLGRALGTAPYNTGVCGTYGTSQPLDHAGGYGVFGHNRPGEFRLNVGTAGYVEGTGVIFPALDGRYGVAGVCRPGTDMVNIGTLGYTGTGNPANVVAEIGIYGEARDWAGWFTGDTWTTGFGFYNNGTFIVSDGSLKENIQDLSLEQSSNVVGQLRPVTYDFTAAAVEGLGVTEGTHPGLIAQELEQLLPGLVRETTRPAVVDSLGNIVHQAMTIKTVNYTGLIPYLIAHGQQLQTRLDAMDEQLAACCAVHGAGPRNEVQGSSSLTSLPETDLRIIPNPVADQTELRYTVGTEGRTRLEVTDASGRTVLTKDEGVRSTGTFSYGWDTTSLAPGTYFCTLYVNDEPLVKKAVKLNAR